MILVRFNNDATACFDRIIPHILSLCLRSYQIPPEFTALLGNLLRYAKYAIKTANGISTKAYSHSENSLVFGSGQGSTASATELGKLVSIALDILDKHSFGSHYKDPRRAFEKTIDMLSYVDDNNISNNRAPHESVADIIRKTQQDAQLWNNILKWTGGILNLLKCFFQVINYTFARNGSPVVAPTDPEWFINITNKSDGTSQRVQAISTYTPYKSLGTIQGLCKQQNNQFEIQLGKSKHLTQARTCSGVSSEYAWIHWNSVFVSSISYPLGVCHLTGSQLHNLQKKYTPVALNKMEFVRTYAQSIVLGPRSHGGISAIDLTIEQGIMIYMK